MTPVRLESGAPQSQVKHSTTEPLRSQINFVLANSAENLLRGFDFLLVFLKEFFKKVDFEKVSKQQQKHKKLSSMQISLLMNLSETYY